MQLGNKAYVHTLLEAQERIFIQKGHFHQLMHHLGGIYTQFYGAFMQPFQVSNRVKRVTGDPVKNGFQCHDNFAVKLYTACNRFMLRNILGPYQESRVSWEQSNREPSQMVALFLIAFWCYLQCKKTISLHDGWHLEIESCNLLPVWMYQKHPLSGIAARRTEK